MTKRRHRRSDRDRRIAKLEEMVRHRDQRLEAHRQALELLRRAGGSTYRRRRDDSDAK